LLFLTSFLGNTAELVWSDISQLNLDEHVEFTVSDVETLTGDEKWVIQTDALPRSKEQYLHFRVSIHNPQNIDQSLWLVIPFPAIKHLSI
jgi:hypothetical protein